ncbi:helix-turn-helix transcriptional regulator [Actinomadura graeca]|uniref:Helix-turn-helix transcriptional regulator n=1 Tax=Actinomadura graeca TaxID=2750812 RepID=A0ABX8QPQ5_9ACTN|nr:helix-turn-helix transcriptional regulator [Actinomadura graeca]QXJ19717.1 helix-turn-helix transcriptional regulator [Actinomadura graeca]
MDGIRRGFTTDAIAEKITRNVQGITPLEAWRIAYGYERSEVAARMDALYEADGLQPPSLDAATLCRWELGDRRPGDERIEYLCRLYRTRPDKLGFGTDHSPGDVGHVQRAGIIDAFPFTSEDSERDLIERISAAQRRINLFGLTRSFYASEEMLSLLEEKARTMDVRIYVMDPYCDSRKDRYRIEPADATMEDPERYIREILRPLRAAADRAPRLRLFLFNFACSFAMEEVDSTVRVMMYGHGRRGTHGPIIVFAEGTSSHTYFVEQFHWLERLASGTSPEPWRSKGVEVRPFDLW